MDQPKFATGTTSDDPLRTGTVGDTIKFDVITPFTSNATRLPEGINNWEFFKGAIVALAFKSDDYWEVLGSAVIVAPGLAITATHVLHSRSEQLSRGEIQVFCIGIRDSDAQLWVATTVVHSSD